MKTKIICVLDRSYSMDDIIDESIEGLNSFIFEQKKINSDDEIKIVFFDNKIETSYDGKLSEIEKFNINTYVPQGTTALYDGIGIAIDEELDYLAENPINRVDKTMFVILTDGFENASKIYHQEQIKRMVTEMETEFEWKFVFLGANQDSVFVAKSFGISEGSTMTYVANGEGVKNAYEQINVATSYYRTTTDVNYDNIMK